MPRTELHLSQLTNTEQYALNESVQTTQSTSYVSALQLVLNSTGTTYLVFVSAEGLCVAKDNDLEVRLIIDGVTEAASFIVSIKSSDKWFGYSTHCLLSLLAGPRNISLEFQSISGGTVKIRRARIFAFDLS